MGIVLKIRVDSMKKSVNISMKGSSLFIAGQIANLLYA